MLTLNDLLQKRIIWPAREGLKSNASQDSLEEFLTPLMNGTVHELFYSFKDALSFPPTSIPLSILTAIDTHTGHKEKNTKQGSLIIWIGKEVWPTPFFLRDCFSSEDTKKNSFQNFLFINVRNFKERYWAIETALSSLHVKAVISYCPKLSFPLSQRLLLASKRGNTFGFLFRDEKELKVKSAAYTRWLVSPLPSQSDWARWSLSLLHTKGCYPDKNHWFVELENEKKVSFNLLPQLVRQPDSENIAYRHSA